MWNATMMDANADDAVLGSSSVIDLYLFIYLLLFFLLRKLHMQVAYTLFLLSSFTVCVGC